MAGKYHIQQCKKGKWTTEQFKEVDWEHLDLSLKSKANNYKIWQSKQALRFCGTQVQVGLYSGDLYPDEHCPNCGARETNAHLMRCPDKDRTCLLIKNVDELEKWMDTDEHTDPELIYWIPKYILMRNGKPFSHMGHMSAKMQALAESQDKIGWRNFMEVYISCHFYNIQRFHLSMSSSYLNGFDWTKMFIFKILQITHSQWIYWNISLHDKKHGYLRNKQLEDLLQDIAALSDISPEDIPDNCQFLLKFNFTKLTAAHLETQRYWILAMDVAIAARHQEQQRGAQTKRILHKLNRKIPSRKKLGITEVERQIRHNGMHCPRTSIVDSNFKSHKQTTLTSLISKQPHPSASLLTLKSNKRLRKPDWLTRKVGTSSLEATNLTCFWLTA